MQRLIQYTVVVLSISLLTGCDRDALTAIPNNERVGQPALTPRVVGAYAGSVVAQTRTEHGQERTQTCPLAINVERQDDEEFSGTFAIRGRSCGTYSGTVEGRVQEDGEVDLAADMSGGGDNVFEDAEERSGCDLVSKDGFDGAIAGNVLTLEAEAAYDCPMPSGEVRTFVNLDVSASGR